MAVIRSRDEGSLRQEVVDLDAFRCQRAQSQVSDVNLARDATAA